MSQELASDSSRRLELKLVLQVAQPSAIPGLVSSTALLSKHLQRGISPLDLPRFPITFHLTALFNPFPRYSPYGYS